MWKLVIKDFRAHLGYLVFLFAFIASISMGFNIAIKSGNDIETELQILTVILSAMVASKLFILTEVENGTDKLFLGFPVARKQMVLAKYMSSILMILITMSVYLITVYLISDETQRHENEILYRPAVWIVSALILIVSDFFSFPFYFGFGPVKGALIYGFTLIAFMILTVLVINLLNPGMLLHQFYLLISQQPAGLILVELVVLFLLIAGGSILISIRTFNHKDL